MYKNKNCPAYLFVFLMQLASIYCQSSATGPITISICAGVTQTLDCSGSPNQTVMILESFYGVQNPSFSECGYNSGDCTEQSNLQYCSYLSSKCSIFSSNYKYISACGNKKANYLHVIYFCVPTSYANNVNTLNVCNDNGDITQNQGFLQSPQYPTYTTQNTTCVSKISVPAGKSINLWVVDLSILPKDSTGSCKTDLLRITDSTGTKELCGSERPLYYNSFCSNVVYVSYLTPTRPFLSVFYRGFRVYYETYDIPSQSSCGTQTPPAPTTTTTATTITQPPSTTQLPIGNFQASNLKDFRVCRLDPSLTLSAPTYYTLFIESLIYAVPSSLTCEAYSPDHCKVPKLIECNLETSCKYSLVNERVTECGNQVAQYIYGTYRLIPTESTTSYSVCDAGDINADLNPYGLIHSKNYPNWEGNTNCQRVLKSTNPNKSFKIYMVDIDIDWNYDSPDDECSDEYVSFNDGNQTKKFCAYVREGYDYSYTSCLNSIQIAYNTDTGPDFYYRGFKSYYELVDKPSFCGSPIVQTTSTTTVSPTTTPDNSYVISPVLSNDNNGAVQPCYFPFSYQGQSYSSCINLDNSDYWCSLTSNYDVDMKRGKCQLGLTQLVKFDICRGKFRQFGCPAGYVINIIAAEYVATNDGSCDYNQMKCSETAFIYVQSACTGKNNCTYYGSASYLSTCSNTPSNLVHIDYNCIPDTAPLVKVNSLCSATSISDDQGIIQTPNYPTVQNNLDCTIQYTANENKYIRIYAVSIDLQVLFFNQPCNEYYVQVNDETKICGTKTGRLIYEGCSNNFAVKIKTGSTSYKGVKLFYEATRINDASLCPATTLPVSTVTVSGDTTTPSNIPVYAQQGIVSPLQVKSYCLVGGQISCPANYVISIRQAFYGRSTSGSCFYTENDCVSFQTTQVSSCYGKNSCYITYLIKILPECNNLLSNYMQVEYECVPTNYTITPMCGQTFTAKNGIIGSPNYPVLAPNLNCQATISVNSSALIKAYILDLSIDPSCSSEYLSLTGSNSVNMTYCGELNSIFALESCSNVLNVNLVTNQDSTNKRGVTIYYEEIPRPFNFNCNPPVQTVPTTTTTTTTTTTVATTTPKPSYYGLASPSTILIGCQREIIACPENYIIVILTSSYGVKRDQNGASCAYNPDDCLANFATPPITCPGNANCAINFQRNTSTVADCNNRKADYYYIEYRCIPVTEAGNPIQPNVELDCSSQVDQYSVPPNSGLIFRSPGYPNYVTSTVSCTKNITIASGNILSVYLSDVKIQGFSFLCSISSDKLTISDGIESFTLCGTSNAPRLLLPSSNWVQIQFTLTKPIFLSTLYKGFQLYIQAASAVILPTLPSLPPGFTTPTTPTRPLTTFQLGYASPNYHDEICDNSRKDIVCPDSYTILVHNEYLISTGEGCRHSPQECRQPTDRILTDCAGNQNCSIYLAPVQLARCGSKYADLLDFEYQCIPAIPGFSDLKGYTCDDKIVENVPHGFVSSPNYPTYASINNECELKITPPPNSGIKFYLVDLGLSLPSTDDANLCSSDYLDIDGAKFCANSLPKLAYTLTDSKTISIKYKTLTNSQIANQSSSSLRGFNLYFESFLLNQPTTTRPRPPGPPSTNYQFTAIQGHEKADSLMKGTLGFGIPVVVILIVAIIVVFKFQIGSISLGKMQIKYSKKGNDGSINDDIRSFANPNADSSLYDDKDLNRMN